MRDRGSSAPPQPGSVRCALGYSPVRLNTLQSNKRILSLRACWRILPEGASIRLPSFSGSLRYELWSRSNRTNCPAAMNPGVPASLFRGFPPRHSSSYSFTTALFGSAPHRYTALHDPHMRRRVRTRRKLPIPSVFRESSHKDPSRGRHH